MSALVFAYSFFNRAIHLARIHQGVHAAVSVRSGESIQVNENADDPIQS